MAKKRGLHIESDPSTIQLAEEEIEQRRTIWWSCRFLDLRLAILNGQATILFARDISTIPLSQKFLVKTSDTQETEISSELIRAFHIDFAVLQDVILSQIFSFDSPTNQEHYARDAHLKYMSWHSTLPSCLRNIVGNQSRFPTLIFFHMDFQCGLILLHRSSTSSESSRVDYANKQCLKAASTISTLLSAYQKYHNEIPNDFMIIHALLTAAIVHLIALKRPEADIYRSSLLAFRNIAKALKSWSSDLEPAKQAYGNLRDLALNFQISPVNSQAYWDAE
ncbi:hypothetical protein BKA61DRAFT_356634 [Leptodontidium sp. MPI-SDFR-AT-0119]|nr:hypothetical protein BKA61DRAFT_356634 [Leptodontidium sp. MPI-SDFR-AT-0119]